MRGSRTRFTVDREAGKLLGVCAGIARHTGIDVTLVRIGLVVVTLVGAFPWTVVAYLAAFMVGNKGVQGARSRGFRSAATPAAGLASREETRERVRNLDLRMQAIETYVTSSNSRLAREIEELR